MTGILRRSAAVGLSILLLAGLPNPAAFAARAPATPNPAISGLAVSGPAPSAPVSSAPASTAIGSSSAAPTTLTPTTLTPRTYAPLPVDFALEVAPTRLAVGQADIAKVQHIEVINRGRLPVAVVVEKKGFVGSKDGTMNFEPNAPFSATTWVTVTPARFSIPAHSSVFTNITIAVPKNADPGDHEVAVIFLVPATKTTGNIAVNRGIATPVYITIPGPIVNAAEIDSLSVAGFGLGGAMAVTATLRNTGTVHRDFRGAGSLQLTADGTSANFPDFTMLRGSTRIISTTWKPPLMCICYPSVALQRADGSVQTMSVRVIIFPLQWLGLVLLAVLLVILAVRLSRRRFQHRVRIAALALNQAVSTGEA